MKSILNAIAETHQVKFSYIEEELVVYRLVPPDAALSLEAKIAYLEKNTRLRFEMATQNYYTVYNDKRMDKPLCGYLMDSKSGMPIENAAIAIPALGITIASDAKGYFELPVLTPNAISIRHLSYAPKQLSPSQLYVSDCPKILMDVIVEELPEINTQRYLATGITRNDFGVIAVKPAKFGILPGLTEPDVLQTMQQLPGVTSIDETISNINVRGGTHDQNLFTYNGIRMFQTGHFFGLISAFNPMLATHIKISKNGSSAFLGESVSSTIDISSHTRIIDSCYNAIAVDMINANFFSKVRLSDNATIQAAGRRTFTDIVKTPTFKAYEDRVFQNNVVTDLSDGQTVGIESAKEFYFYDFALQYHQKLGRHELIVDGIGIENRVDFEQRTDISLKESYASQRNFGASLNWKSHWNDKNESDVQGYFSWYKLGAENQSGDQNAQQQNRVSNKGLKIKHTFIPEQRFEIGIGYQFDETSIKNTDEVDNPPFFRESTEISRSHSLIAEGLYHSANEKTQLQIGVRGNYFEKFDLFRLEPRIAFNQALSQRWKFDLLAELKSQTLSQVIDLQEDFLGIEKRRWILANGNDIPMQKSKQASFGFTYLYDGWLFSIDNFYKEISGITTQGQGFQDQYEFVRAIGRSDATGSELLLQKSFTQFYTWISYAWNENKYHFDDLEPTKFPSNTNIIHNVSWAGIYEWKQLRFALGAKWHSGRPYTRSIGFLTDPDNPANSSITFSAPNAERLNDYFQLNFSASHQWHFKKSTSLFASISLLNLLDRKNIINRYYRVNTSLNTVENVDTYSLGFTPNVCIKVVF
ncbi:TonB-dependent receptor plug domain-containing protein [Flavobacterium sp.]|uniref:TonB-dependent receptor n=1 Tax=Flavobacterium sp. TaxID=239 RepID=UPI0039E5EDAE